MVTQENYWNSSGHFSAHDLREGGRSVMSVPCEATAGSESQRQQRKGGLMKNRQFEPQRDVDVFGQIHQELSLSGIY